jgi:hypothetical protein
MKNLINPFSHLGHWNENEISRKFRKREGMAIGALLYVLSFDCLESVPYSVIRIRESQLFVDDLPTNKFKLIVTIKI